MDFLRKLSAAITGELLFRLAYAIEKIILFPILFYELFPTNSIGWNILAGILSASLSLLVLASWVFSPAGLLGSVIALGLVNHTMDYGFKGALTGWEHGFKGVFNHVADRFQYIISKLTGARYLSPQPLNTPDLFTRLNTNVEPMDLRRFLTILHSNMVPPRMLSAGWNNFLNPIHGPLPFVTQPNPVALNPLDLPPAKLTLLIKNQQRLLNTEEIEWLESASTADIKKTVGDYLVLWERLEKIGECCIIQDRPAKENAVLLVKLYARDGKEYPVPKSSTIFDKASLAQWLTNHNSHPLTRDSISAPSLYEDFPTRYVRHPYYATPESTSGISQELNEMADMLRSHLEQLLMPPVERERNRAIAARLRFYGVAGGTAGVDSSIVGPRLNLQI